MIGTARIAPTAPVQKYSELDQHPGVWRVHPLGSSNSSLGLKCIDVARCVRSIVAGIGLAWELRPLGHDPGDYIGDIFEATSVCLHIATPIGSTQFAPPDNYGCAKTLIAHQRDIGAVDNGTRPLASMAVRAMA